MAATYTKGMVLQALDWLRERALPESGFVIFYESRGDSEPFGWTAADRIGGPGVPNGYVPGVLALGIGKNDGVWIAEGGNEQDGAKVWRYEG